MLVRKHNARVIDLVHPVPVLQGFLSDGVIRPADACGSDQNIELSEFVHAQINSGLNVLFIRHIALDPIYIPFSVLGRQMLGNFQYIFTVIGNHNAPVAGQEFACSCQTEPAGTARDQGSAAGQIISDGFFKFHFRFHGFLLFIQIRISRYPVVA